jgi:hypothetical protein
MTVRSAVTEFRIVYRCQGDGVENKHPSIQSCLLRSSARKVAWQWRGMLLQDLDNLVNNYKSLDKQSKRTWDRIK